MSGDLNGGEIGTLVRIFVAHARSHSEQARRVTRAEGFPAA